MNSGSQQKENRDEMENSRNYDTPKRNTFRAES